MGQLYKKIGFYLTEYEKYEILIPFIEIWEP